MENNYDESNGVKDNEGELFLQNVVAGDLGLLALDVLLREIYRPLRETVSVK